MTDMMSYATKGWVKLMRSFIDSRSFDNANATAAYTHCLLRANYSVRIVKGVFLQRGQFITSNAQFAEECGLTDKQMRNAFRMLEDDGLIKREPVPSRANGGANDGARNRANNGANNGAKNGTLVTVVNYDDIGIREEEEGEQWGEQQGEHWGEQQGEHWGERWGNSIRRKEEDIEKEYITDSKESVCRTDDVRRVKEAWNDLGLGQVSTVTAHTTRGKSLKARINQNGVDKVLEAIERVRKSSFLQGQNKKGWTISFDWFVKPNNFLKVLEGQYDDHEPDSAGGSGINNYYDDA